MTFFTDGPLMEPEHQGIHELPLSTGSYVAESFKQGLEETPTAQLLRAGEVLGAKGQPEDMELTNEFGSKVTLPAKPVPTVPMEEAKKRVKDAGLDRQLNNLGDAPEIGENALDIMMRHARERAHREAQLARGPSGILPGVAATGASFFAGALDPLSLAAFSVPVLGEARVASLMASAGDSIMARAATRFGVGATQGAVGMAALQPLEALAHSVDARDFTFADALTNVATGAGLGGVLHAGGGGIADIWRGFKGRPVYPFASGEPFERTPGVPPPAAPLLGAPSPAPTPTARVPGAPLPAGAYPEVEALLAHPEVRGQPANPKLNFTLDDVLNTPHVAEAIEHPLIERDHDVPFGSAARADLTGTHIDRNVPSSATIDGTTFDPAIPANIARHVEREAIERMLEQFRQARNREPNDREVEKIINFARKNFATPAEKAWVARHGIDWDKYQDAWRGWKDKIDHENPVNPPGGLYTTTMPPRLRDKLAGGEAAVPEAPTPPPEPAAGTVGSVPFMITARMKRDLRDLGYSDEQISELRPAEAHALINARAAAPTPPPDTTGLAQMGGDMGKGIADSMYQHLWDLIQAGEVTETTGMPPSALLQAAKMIRARGGLQTFEQYKAFADDYGRNIHAGTPTFQRDMRMLVERHGFQAEAPLDPSRLYLGTQEAFSPEKLAATGANNGTEKAIFLAPSEELARDYGHTITPVAIEAKNPKTIDWRKREGVSERDLARGATDWNEADMAREIDRARAEGHDVLYIENIEEPGAGHGPHTQVAVLDPGIIKSTEAAKPSWFHGTPAQFTHFVLDEIAKTGEPDIAIALSSSQDIAKAYAGKDGRVIEVQTNFKNPMIIRQEGHGSRYQNFQRIQEAKAKGHDGIIFEFSKPSYLNDGTEVPPSREALAWEPGTIVDAKTGEDMLPGSAEPAPTPSPIEESLSPPATEEAVTGPAVNPATGTDEILPPVESHEVLKGAVASLIEGKPVRAGEQIEGTKAEAPPESTIQKAPGPNEFEIAGQTVRLPADTFSSFLETDGADTAFGKFKGFASTNDGGRLSVSAYGETGEEARLAARRLLAEKLLERSTKRVAENASLVDRLADELAHIYREEGKQAANERFNQILGQRNWKDFEIGILKDKFLQRIGEAAKPPEPVETTAPISLADHFRDYFLGAPEFLDKHADYLEDGKRFATIVQARRFAKDMGFGTDAKVIDEAIEHGAVQAARAVAQGEGTEAGKFADLVALYDRQPRLSARTSTSMRDQAYSTPVPLAYVASRLGRVEPRKNVYEPSAGNGALLLEVDPPNYAVANEINPARAKTLEDQGFRVTRQDASDPAQGRDLRHNGGVDVVLANPPFGPVKEGTRSKVFDLSDIQQGYSTHEIDHAIALRSLEAMKDDGRAVLLIGGINKMAKTAEARSEAYNGKAKREFFKVLFDRYTVTDHFTVAGELYERQGAGWPIDVLVIAGRGRSSRGLPAVNPPRVLNSWDEVGKVLNEARRTQDAGPAGGAPGGPPVALSEPAGPRQPDVGGGAPGAGGGPGGGLAPQGQPEGVRVGPVPRQPGDVSAGGERAPEGAGAAGLEPGLGDAGRPGGEPAAERPAPGVAEPALSDYAQSVVGDVIKQVTRVGSTVGGKAGRDIDLVYDLGDRKLPADSDEASQVIEDLIENVPNLDLDRFDSFFKVGDRYFHLQEGAGRAIVENTKYAIDQADKPTEVIAQARQPAPPPASAEPSTSAQAAAEATKEALEPQPAKEPPIGDAGRPGGEPAAERPAPGVTTKDKRWWDFELTAAGRREVLDKVGVKLPDKVRWDHMSPEDQQKVAAERPAEQPKPITPQITPDSQRWEKLSTQERERLLTAIGDLRADVHADIGWNDLSQRDQEKLRDEMRQQEPAAPELTGGYVLPSFATHGLRPEAGTAEQAAAEATKEALEPQPTKEAPPKTKPRVVKTETETASQVAYTPQSTRSEGLGTLTPINMRKSIADSLEAVAARRGPVDRFVADELGYAPDEMATKFAAEQVDALALALDNIKSGKGFIIGDQTGIGKGRVNAGIIRWAIRNKRIPVFVTEKPNLYGDMYRDLSDIGIADMLGREPKFLMTNADEKVPLSEDGKLLLKSGPASAHNAMMLGLPHDAVDFLKEYDAVFTNYSQMQTVAGQDTARRAFLRKIAPDSVVIFDESHNAGGQKKGYEIKGQAPDRAAFARELVNKATGVFYSSATYAKRPDVMDLYSKTDMAMAVADPKDLGEAIAKGGVPMQQAVASMLARAGQYVRRERSFHGVEYNTPSVPVERATYDGISRALNAVNEFSKLVAKAAEGIDNDIKASAGNVASDGSTGNAGAQSTNFTSIMHNIVGQVLLAMKAKPAARMAIEALERGEKPVITVAGTMESFLKDFAENMDVKAGDPVTAGFGDVIKKYLDRTRTLIIRKPFAKKGDTERKYLSDAELGPMGVRAYGAAKEMIEKLDLKDLPISPIDAIKNELTKAGYSVGEITGRGTIIDYAGKRPILKPRPGAEVTIRGRRDTISRFNGGIGDKPLPKDQVYDAMVLNQAGATGLSLHASERFADQRQRHMFIAQPEANIDTHMQLLGRIHRTGQVVLPKYSQLIADIPAEKRPAAVLAKKMASLNANTTAARGGAMTAKDVPDFMNAYGDMVAAALIQESPELNARLGNPVKFTEAGRVEAEDAMRKLTGRIPLLPLKDQESLYGYLETEYHSLLEQMKAAGENALEAQTLDLRAQTVERREVVARKSASDSPFAAPVQVERVMAKRLGKPFKSNEVVSKVLDGLGEKGYEGTVTADNAGRLLENIGNPSTPVGKRAAASHEVQSKDATSRFESYKRGVLDELETPERQEQERAKQDAYRDRWQATHDMLPPGQRVVLKTANGNLTGIVLKVEQKGKPKNPLALSTWKADIAIADATKRIELPFSRLYQEGTADSEDALAIEVGHISDWLETKQKTLDRFDSQQSDTREERHIATGNLLAAYDWLNRKGRIVNYTDAQGHTRQGILTPRDFDFAVHASTKKTPIGDEHAVMDYLQAHPGEAVNSADGAVTVKLDRGRATIWAAAAKRVGGTYYLDRNLTNIVGDFRKVGNQMIAATSPEKMTPAIKRLQELGATFAAVKELPPAEEVGGARPPPTMTREQAWDALSSEPLPHEERDAVERSRDAEAAPEPASAAPDGKQRVAAAAKAEQDTAAQVAQASEYLTDEDRAAMDRALQDYDREQDTRAQVIREGIACLTVGGFEKET